MEKAYLIPCYGIMGLEKKQNWFKEKAFLKGWFKNGGLEDQGLSFSKIKQSKRKMVFIRFFWRRSPELAPRAIIPLTSQL